MGADMSKPGAMVSSRRNHPPLAPLESEPQVEQQPSTEPATKEPVTKKPAIKEETSVDEPPTKRNSSTSSLSLALDDATTNDNTKPNLTSLPPEVLGIILSHALREPYNSCSLHRPRLPAVCHVSRHLRDASIALYLWMNDWNISVRVQPTQFPDKTFRLHLPINEPASVAAFSQIPHTAPLFRRFRVWGDHHLGGPFLAFSIHRGQPRVEHGSPCALCGNWPLELIRPERSPTDAWMEAWESQKAKHDIDLMRLGRLLFRDLEIEGRGFSIQKLRDVVGRIKGNALNMIKISPHDVSRLRSVHHVLFRVDEEEWVPSSP